MKYAYPVCCWLLVSVVGCTPPPEGSKPSKAPALAPDAALVIPPPTPAPKLPAPISPATAACRALVEPMWAEARLSLVALGVAAPDDYKARYIKGSKTFVRRCAELSEAKRACLKSAKAPLTAVETCKVNDGRSPAMRLRPYGVLHRANLLEPVVQDAAVQREALAAVVGTWQTVDSAGVRQTWTVHPSGRGEAVVKDRAGRTRRERFEMGFPEARRARITRGHAVTNYTFVPDGPDRFYASQNLAHGAFLAPTGGTFLLRLGGGIVQVKGGRCTAFSSEGVRAEATCRAYAKGMKVQIVSPGGARREQTFHRVGEVLMDNWLMVNGRFERVGG